MKRGPRITAHTPIIATMAECVCLNIPPLRCWLELRLRLCVAVHSVIDGGNCIPARIITQTGIIYLTHTTSCISVFSQQIM